MPGRNVVVTRTGACSDGGRTSRQGENMRKICIVVEEVSAQIKTRLQEGH